MTWEFEKFTGDDNIYAICPHCGFYHDVGSAKRQHSGIQQLKGCPSCGKFLYDSSTQVNIAWNKRSLAEFLEKQEKIK